MYNLTSGTLHAPGVLIFFLGEQYSRRSRTIAFKKPLTSAFSSNSLSTSIGGACNIDLRAPRLGRRRSEEIKVSCNEEPQATFKFESELHEPCIS